MSYNNKYNTRNSGRYNTPGQFVPGGEQAPQPPQPQSVFAQAQGPRNQNLQMIQTQDVEMKTEVSDASATGGEANGGRPHWMKSKLAGVKKLSNKERRRRQNENLRRLLTPKNALMVLNEMMPNEQLANQFKVEPASQFNSHQYYSKGAGHSFCADLTLDGNTYKGYGENKLTARNAAAEQAIRDLIIKKMGKVMGVEGGSQSGEEPAAGVVAAGGAVAGGAGVPEGAGGEGDEETLPMIQLASFALHKLFSEWEYEGHKVPQLKPHGHAVSECGTEATGAAAAAAGPPGPLAAPRPRSKKLRELPANAAAMHPCMLLTYMRPALEYRELAVEGDRPQNMTFTLGVDVDGATYIGKATNKKEARKAAAKSACQALFNVRFDDVPTASAPVPKAE